MRAKGPSTWRKGSALLILLFLTARPAVSAQTGEATSSNLETRLSPGMTVWITDATGREEKTRVVGAAGSVLTTTSDDSVRRFRTTDIVRIRARRSDSLINGAVIGAGVAIASGLFLCRATEPWENCRDDIGPMLRIGALGAGIGIGADALIRGRKTIYEAAEGPTRLQVTPLVGRRAGGLQFSLSF